MAYISNKDLKLEDIPTKIQVVSDGSAEYKKLDAFIRSIRPENADILEFMKLSISKSDTYYSKNTTLTDLRLGLYSFWTNARWYNGSDEDYKTVIEKFIEKIREKVKKKEFE